MSPVTWCDWCGREHRDTDIIKPTDDDLTGEWCGGRWTA
jgi:hypothetical protein